jgi:hypothetical protein
MRANASFSDFRFLYEIKTTQAKITRSHAEQIGWISARLRCSVSSSFGNGMGSARSAINALLRDDRQWMRTLFVSLDPLMLADHRGAYDFPWVDDKVHE